MVAGCIPLLLYVHIHIYIHVRGVTLQLQIFTSEMWLDINIP